ncbi:hypothetical protein DPEC_G00371230, partial [Dallia pectoralis]
MGCIDRRQCDTDLYCRVFWMEVSVSDRGQYRCRAGRGDPVYYTQYSEPVYIQVTERPVAVLIPKPKWKQLFWGESVTLRCDIQSLRDPDWKYEINMNGRSVYSDTKPEYRISPLYTSHTGSYTCRGVKGNKISTTSNAVQLTVTYPPSASVMIVSPQKPWYTKEKVTLQCYISDYTDWTYQWYRDDQQQSTGSSSETITTLSDQAGQYQYQCMGTRTGRPQLSQRSGSLHITVT